MAALEPPDAAEDTQLWAAVRGLSDAKLHDVQERIRQFHCIDGPQLLSARDAHNVAIELKLDDSTQRVRADDFAHVFVGFLHRQVQLHADARVSSDSTTSIGLETSQCNMATSDGTNMATFEEEFPQLKANVAKTTKRRITTILLTPKDSTVVARPVTNNSIAFPPLGASESTRPPAWAKRSLLERRMGTAATSTSTAWGSKPMENNDKPMSVWGTKPDIVSTAPPLVDKTESVNITMQVTTKKKMRQQVQEKKKEDSNQVTHLQHETSEKQKRRGRFVLNQEEDEAAAMTDKKSSTTEQQAGVPLTGFQVNKQAAKLYGFLIRERFVKSTCAELQILISLLYRADCVSCSRSDSESKETTCGEASEFCWRTHCLDFAEIVFLEIEPVLTHLGGDLLGLVKHSLRDAEGICSDMLERLDQVSRQREELRVAESARIGCQLPVEMKASAVRDFALPFNEETDSRLHYRTPAESLLFTNREKVRDGFLSLLRQFQHKQHSLVGIDNAGVAATAISAAQELLAEVSPENRWWFAKFFVQELVQVGSNPFGESDKDLVLKIMEDKLLEKNPDRLLKLHRRFSSQKPSNKSPRPYKRQSTGGGSSSAGYTNNRGSGKSNNNSLRKNRPDTRTTMNEDDATKNFTATLDRMRSYFTDNQLFFFHFLHSCDSYEFSELVKHQLERQFYTILETTSPSADARKEFTEVVLKLKVVAKFLGYLRFSPQWQVTSSIRRLSSQNAAFKAVEREGISTLEVARDSSLDVKQLLENSILQASISKCIPWLCDYVSMLSLDKLSSGTTYFKQLVLLLQLLYRSPRLNSLGETGLYVAMQIERIFRVLRLDGGVLLSKDLLPSSEIREVLACDDEFSFEESGTSAGEDRLPFLYSQVFVQSCVSELDDLRGFIQTRAQPSPRRKLSIGSGSMASGQPVTPIRKLRPLQVVLEDDQGVKRSSSFSTKQDNAVPTATSEVKLPEPGFPSNFPPVQEENDKLSEALFKVHPKLKAVVEFVVGTVTTDVCEYVMVHVVTPRADVLVDRCALESGLLTVGSSTTTSAPGEDAAFGARASFQMLITSKTRHEANCTNAAALQEALRLGEERVSAAVPPLVPPSSHPTLTNSIVFVALQRTRGALKTLVPKSSQTEFVKRVAFRNKSLLKDLGSAAKTAARATSSFVELNLKTPSNHRWPGEAASNQEEPQSSLGEQRYGELRQCIADISKTVNGNEPVRLTLAEWELQATALSKSLSQFTVSFNACVAAGDLIEDADSLLSMSALVFWDIVWRVTTYSLQFLESSLGVFVANEVLSMKEERTAAVEVVYNNVVTDFSILLDVIIRAVGETIGVSRLKTMLAFVMDRMKQLPSKRLALTSDGGNAVVKFAVRASSQVMATLQTVVPAADSDEYSSV